MREATTDPCKLPPGEGESGRLPSPRSAQRGGGRKRLRWCAVAGVLLGTVLLCSSASADTQAQAIVKAAASQQGRPYCFDGGNKNGPTRGDCSSGTVGFDCTGLTLYAVYRATGKVLSHDGRQATEGGRIITKTSDLLPGDLVFFGGTLRSFEHAGVYAGNGMIWDALNYGVPVRLHSFSQVGLPFVGGARYWKGSPGTKAPAPPPTNPDDLGFVKLKNTGGTVEAHWDTLVNGSFHRRGDYPSDFSPADANNGVWQLFGSINGAPELGFIKLRNTAGTVEVHWDTLVKGTYRRAGDYTSDFSPADAGNGAWNLFGDSNGVPQLGFVKLHNTAGTVEVHWDTLQRGAYRRTGDYISDFHPGDASNGTWQLFGGSSGPPQLGFVKTHNTAGTVEVHWDALQQGAYRRVRDYPSDFHPGDAGNGTWQLFGSINGAPELGFIKLRNTGGTVEGHSDTLIGSSYHRVSSAISDFSPTDANNGAWELAGAAPGQQLAVLPGAPGLTTSAHVCEHARLSKKCRRTKSHRHPRHGQKRH